MSFGFDQNREAGMDFDLSSRSEAWLEKLQGFFDQEVLPRHRAWLDHVARGEAAPFMFSWHSTARRALDAFEALAARGSSVEEPAA